MPVKVSDKYQYTQKLLRFQFKKLHVESTFDYIYLDK